MLHILSCAAYAQTSANPGVILTNGAKFYASCVKEDAVFKYRGEPANGKTIAYLGPLRDCNDIVDLSEPCVSTDPYHPGLFSCTFEAAGTTIERTAVTANRYESAIDGGAPGVGVACEMPVEGDITGDGTITLKIEHRVPGATPTAIQYVGIPGGNTFPIADLTPLPSPPPPPPPCIDDATHVTSAGFTYRTINGNTKTSTSHGSTTTADLAFSPMPDGYEIAPSDDVDTLNVIKQFPWGQYRMCTLDKCYNGGHYSGAEKGAENPGMRLWTTDGSDKYKIDNSLVPAHQTPSVYSLFLRRACV